MLKRAPWLCSFIAFAFLPLHCDAAQKQVATAEERADAIKWASEEPGHAAKRFLPGVDYPAVVRRCLEGDERVFGTSLRCHRIPMRRPAICSQAF